MSVEVLGRRWLNSRSSPPEHARENRPDEPRQADWLFNSGTFESPPLQEAPSYPAGAIVDAATSTSGVNADAAALAAIIASTPTHLAVPEDAQGEDVDRLRSHHVLDQGQRRPSQFKPKKRRQLREVSGDEPNAELRSTSEVCFGAP
jgi:hypothetical protein